LLNSGSPAHQILACNKSNLERRASLQALGVQLPKSNQEAAQAIDNYMTATSSFDVNEASQFIQQFTIAKQIEQVEKLIEE